MGLEKRVFVIALLIAGVMTSSSVDADTPRDLQVLRDLDAGAVVLVETIDAAGLSYGVSEDTIKAKVELKLLQSGIKVFSEYKDPATPLFTPTVYVRISSLEDDGHLAYTLQLSVLTYAVGVRDAAKLIVAPAKPTPTQLTQKVYNMQVWNKGMIGIAGSARMPAAVYQDVDEKVDVLLRDYLLVRQTKAKEN